MKIIYKYKNKMWIIYFRLNKKRKLFIYNFLKCLYEYFSVLFIIFLVIIPIIIPVGIENINKYGK